ncbi:MAG: hypothetical protein JSS27_12090 [Planctomycetes bacterium]|nr:hypothetical protein [Planctomycetota bacterium]
MIQPGTTIKAELVPTVPTDVPAVPTEVLAWAREELRLDGATSLVDHRVALLKQVEIEGFLPNEAWQSAVEVVRAYEAVRAVEAERADEAVAALHVAAPFLGPVEAKLREQIAELRKGFFELNPDVRRERWRMQWDESAPFPALRKQLAAFEPALDWTPQQMQSESPAVHDMARHLARLFTLSPAERGQQRHLPATESSTNPRQWQQAAPELSQDYPQVARFDGVFVRRLAEAHEAGKPLNKLKRQAKKLHHDAKVKGSPKVAFLHAGPWVWVVIGVALGGARFLLNDYSKSKPTSNYVLTDTQRRQIQNLSNSRDAVKRSVFLIREQKRRERLPDGNPLKNEPMEAPRLNEEQLLARGVPRDVLDPDKPNPYESKAPEVGVGRGPRLSNLPPKPTPVPINGPGGGQLRMSQEELERAVANVRERKRRALLPDGHPLKNKPVEGPYTGEAILRLMGVPPDALDPDKPNPYERQAEQPRPIEQKPRDRKRDRQPKVSDTSQVPPVDEETTAARWQRPQFLPEHLDEENVAAGMAIFQEMQRRRQQQPAGQSVP